MLSIFPCASWPSVCLLWRNIYLRWIFFDKSSLPASDLVPANPSPILHQSFLMCPIILIELNNNYMIVCVYMCVCVCMCVCKSDCCEGVMWKLLYSASPSFPLLCFPLCFWKKSVCCLQPFRLSMALHCITWCCLPWQPLIFSLSKQ